MIVLKRNRPAGDLETFLRSDAEHEGGHTDGDAADVTKRRLTSLVWRPVHTHTHTHTVICRPHRSKHSASYASLRRISYTPVLVNLHAKTEQKPEVPPSNTRMTTIGVETLLMRSNIEKTNTAGRKQAFHKNQDLCQLKKRQHTY